MAKLVSSLYALWEPILNAVLKPCSPYAELKTTITCSSWDGIQFTAIVGLKGGEGESKRP